MAFSPFHRLHLGKLGTCSSLLLRDFLLHFFSPALMFLLVLCPWDSDPKKQQSLFPSPTFPFPSLLRLPHLGLMGCSFFSGRKGCQKEGEKVEAGQEEEKEKQPRGQRGKFFSKHFMNSFFVTSQ